MRLHRVRLALSVVLASAAATSLSAQRADSTTRSDSARRAQALPVMIVTGTLAPAASVRLGVARTVVDRSALAAEPTRAAIQPLRHMTGVHIDEANGPTGPSIIRVRGGDETFTQILIDGVQANENGGFFDWQGLTLVNVDRIEVARGPQSAVYGTSAMTGAVQIVTRAGTPGPMRATLGAEGARTSSHGGGGRTTIEAEGGSDLLRYSVGLGTAFDRGPVQLPQNLRSNDASLRLDLVPHGPVHLTATARYMAASSLLPVRDPGATRAPLDPNSRQGRDRILGALDATWSPSSHWTNRLTLADYHLVFTFHDDKDAFDTAKFPIGFFNFNYHYRAVLNRTTARYVGTVTGQPRSDVAASVSYGGEWSHESLDNEASGDFGPSTQSMSRPSAGAFAEAQVHVGERLSLVGGGRAETIRGIGDAIVPRATAVYELIPHRVAIRAAAASAFIAPNVQYQFADPGFFVGNPDLRAESSRSGEIGVDLTGTTASVSATAFRQSFDNLIRNVAFDTAGKQIFRNLGRSRAKGLELEATLHPTTRWTAGAQAAWTTTEVLDNTGLTSADYPVGKPLPFRPTYTASGFVSVRATSALSVLARLSGVGGQTVLSERFGGSRVPTDPYHLVSGTATYAVGPSLDMYLHLENALDASYVTAFDKPGAPRLAAVGVRVRR